MSHHDAPPPGPPPAGGSPAIPADLDPSAVDLTLDAAPSELGLAGGGLPAGADQSVFDALARRVPDLPRVLLRDPGVDDSAVVRPGGPAKAPGGRGIGRYEVAGEIARGGMGAILRGRDPDLGRELAIKVLLPAHLADPGRVARFVEEAQIAGQLQHPGIVPVYELGRSRADRPYFTMKLVRGKTLAALLGARAGPADDRGRLLGVFADVCEAIAYAHARGVIHRDLKPSNVMVGSFGEVQVMDWGLAKVLDGGGAADEDRARVTQAAQSVIRTVRSGSAGGTGGASEATGSGSRHGSAMGTPAYMPPEQARGDLDLVDERADVFGLGAMLCEVLTGKPPFTGASVAEVQRKAERAAVEEAAARLARCGADAELVELARRCLSAEPWDRPRDAGVVAGCVRGYLDGVRERLRRAELDAVRAQEKAGRVKYVIAAAASVVLLLAGAGATAFVLDRQGQARDARLSAALDVAEQSAARLAGAAEQRVVAPGEWNEVAAAAAGAAELLAADAPAALRARSDALADRATAGRAAADGDRELLADLLAVRAATGDRDFHPDEAYDAAFRRRGYELGDPAAADALAARPPPVRRAMAEALDDWAMARRQTNVPPGPAPLVAAAARLDDDPWRQELRRLLLVPDLGPRRGELLALAGRADSAGRPPAGPTLLATLLSSLNERDAAATLLRRTVDRHPQDVSANLALGRALRAVRPVRRAQALQFLRAARAVRPESGFPLANALWDGNEREEAIGVLEDLVARTADVPIYLLRLADLQDSLGRSAEANALYLRAADAARRRLARTPADVTARLDLGLVLLKQRRYAEAADAVGDAVRRQPGSARGHNALGAVQAAQGDFAAAADSFREAIRLDPEGDEPVVYHLNLGLCLHQLGQSDEAIASFREAVRRQPDSSIALAMLGGILRGRGRAAEAKAAYEEVIRLHPDSAAAQHALGDILRDSGNRAGAVAAYRRALVIEPGNAYTHDGLGWTLNAQGDAAGAIVAFRESVRLKPDYARGWANLGDALLHTGKLPEAVEALRTAVRLGPDDAWPHGKLVDALSKHQGLSRVAAMLEVIRPIQEVPQPVHHLLAALEAEGRLEHALAVARGALGAEPGFAATCRHLGLALRDRGRLADAAAALGEAARLEPSNPMAHARLGLVLAAGGDDPAAVAAYRTAARLRPDRVAGEAVFLALARQGPWLHDPAAELLLTDARADGVAEYQRAVALLILGRDPAGYARACRAMLDRHERSDDGPTIERVARLCATSPVPPADAARVAALAERAIALGSGGGWTWYTAGLAHHRAGEHARAVARLEESIRDDPRWAATALNLPVLAMAHHRLGRAADAARWLAAAEKAAVSSDEYWNDRLELAYLRSEARGLIRGTAARGPATTAADEVELLSPARTSEFLLRAGRPAAAAALLREALRLRPADAEAGRSLGVALAIDGDAAGADAAFAAAAGVPGDAAAARFALGHECARAGRWAPAAAAFARGLDRDSSNHWNGYAAAVLHLEAGDVAGYRRACRELVERFGTADQPDVAERTAKVCLLSPATPADVEQAARLAVRAVTGNEKHGYYFFFQLAQGLAEHRSGRHAEAVRWLAPLAAKPRGSTTADGTVQAVLAMAQHRLGRPAEARAALGKARAAAAASPDPARGRPYGGAEWLDWIICRTLAREAEAVVGAGPATGPGAKGS